ncbi:hypothetical protein ACHAPU_008594 [Fusarium lateritium]
MSSHLDLAKATQDVAFVSRHRHQKLIANEDEAVARQYSVISKGVKDVFLTSDSDHGSDSDSDEGVEGWHLVGKAEIVDAVMSERATQQNDSKGLRFDDQGVVNFHHSDSEQDSDSDSEDDAGGVKRPILFDYEVLMPSDLIDKTNIPPNDCVDSERSLTGMWTVRGTLFATFKIAQTNIARSYNGVTGGIVATTKRTRDAVAATGKVGGHVAGGALAVGQNVAVMIQESWPNLPRPFNRGILDTVTGYLLEGIQSLPPSDAIIRPQGRRMH